MLSSLSSERSANFGANKVLGTNNLTYNIKYGNYNTRKGDGFYSQASRKERQRKRDMSAILKTIVTIAGIAGVSFLAAKFVPWGKVKNAIDKAKPEVKNFFKSTKEKASKAKDSAKAKLGEINETMKKKREALSAQNAAKKEAKKTAKAAVEGAEGTEGKITFEEMFGKKDKAKAPTTEGAEGLKITPETATNGTAEKISEITPEIAPEVATEGASKPEGRKLHSPFEVKGESETLLEDSDAFDGDYGDFDDYDDKNKGFFGTIKDTFKDFFGWITQGDAYFDEKYSGDD